MAECFRLLNERLRQYDRLLERFFRADERCQRLGQIEGVGPLTVTALVAAVGNGQAFSSGRYLSAWLGLVPGFFCNQRVQVRGHGFSRRWLLSCELRDSDAPCFCPRSVPKDRRMMAFGAGAAFWVAW
jgi:hypothetical protein